MTCCNKYRFISTTGVSVIGTQLVLTIPSNTYNNGERICLLVAQDLPSSSSANSVAIQIGTSTTYYPVIKVCGNNVRADQINRNVIYRLTIGTDPGHFTVNNSRCLPCTSFVPLQIDATTA